MILSLCMEFSLNSREGMWVLYNCTILFLTETQMKVKHPKTFSASRTALVGQIPVGFQVWCYLGY